MLQKCYKPVESYPQVCGKFSTTGVESYPQGCGKLSTAFTLYHAKVSNSSGADPLHRPRPRPPASPLYHIYARRQAGSCKLERSWNNVSNRSWDRTGRTDSWELRSAWGRCRVRANRVDIDGRGHTTSRAKGAPGRAKVSHVSNL